MLNIKLFETFMIELFMALMLDWFEVCIIKLFQTQTINLFKVIVMMVHMCARVYGHISGAVGGIVATHSKVFHFQTYNHISKSY